jgi:DNA-binding response OmpR family regulator
MSGEAVLVIDDSPTILKVVQLVLTKAGFHVTTAVDGDEGIEAARRNKPDLILLDFVMPRMNGYQVCQALHQEEGLRDVPVILMSAKGDQVGERFVKTMGIVDYITKPFSPEAITGVVQHTVDKYAKMSGELRESSTQETSPEAAAEAADAAMEARRAALARLREGLAKAVARAVVMGALDQAVSLDDEDVAAWVGRGLSSETLELLLGELRTSAPELVGDSQPALAGDLRGIPIAEVLELLGQQEQTGVLAVTRGTAQVELHFQGGKIMLGTATGLPEELLLGRFILENNLMSKQDLDLFLKSRSGSPSLLGIQLVKLGYLSNEDLKVAIRQQTCELVYDLLRWSSGKFVFRATPSLSPVAADAALGLSVDGILMEGFRRVDEWHLIEREIDNFDLVFLRNEDAVSRMGRGRLTREELAILELVNGKNTVKDIVRQSRMGSFEVSKMLYRLLSIKLIRKRVPVVAV